MPDTPEKSPPEGNPGADHKSESIGDSSSTSIISLEMVLLLVFEILLGELEVNWWLKAIMLVVAGALSAYVAIKWPFSRQFSKLPKPIIGCLAFISVLFISIPTIWHQWLKDHPQSVDEEQFSAHLSISASYPKTVFFEIDITNTGKAPLMIKSVNFSIPDKSGTFWAPELIPIEPYYGLMMPSEIRTYKTKPISDYDIVKMAVDCGGDGDIVITTSKGLIIKTPVDIFIAAYLCGVMSDKSAAPTASAAGILKTIRPITISKEEVQRIHNKMKQIIDDFVRNLKQPSATPSKTTP